MRVIGTAYAQYINGPDWQTKRLERLQHDNHRCSRCQSTETLQVHHVTYERLGRERLTDLLTLCDPCHRSEHGRDPDNAPAMPSAYYDCLFTDRQRMLAEQERIAEEAGIDITAYLNG